ncbi:hypothetical protein FOMPIDRAFT_1024857 [Fomitopsis schrenkii]|uniref:Uncharacterized protein n=1 Tax=Fomitopsis schrenkii TaxID=2126942 RepID=S8DZH3_FOMSC|nr:hypothetical protein FOMPIDRAFT_1024857 [Fomitopsis schrenkii]
MGDEEDVWAGRGQAAVDDELYKPWRQLARGQVGRPDTSATRHAHPSGGRLPDSSAPSSALPSRPRPPRCSSCPAPSCMPSQDGYCRSRSSCPVSESTITADSFPESCPTTFGG